jgi:opacity protein-like surface antigen
MATTVRAEDRLTFGVDWTRFSLSDSRRVTPQGPDNANVHGNYLGSLWGLDAEQHAFPDPFVEWRVISSFGVGLSYEQQRAMTLDWGNDDHSLPPVGDGDVQIRGAQLYAFGRYRNRTRFTPYASVGRAQYWSHFFLLPAWNAGDPAKVLWVGNTSGWIVSGGTRVALGHRLALDVNYRGAFVADVPARAYSDIFDHPHRYRAGAFPMKSQGVRLGVAYAF